MLNGLVLQARGGRYAVETDEGTYDAVLRGRLKQQDRLGDRVVVGDRVRIVREAPPGEGWTIEEVEQRRSTLARRAPGRAPRAKVIAANLDRVVIVFSVTRPDPHLRMLDRFLVLAESNELDPVIVANKVDLSGDDAAERIFGPYRRIGYPVIFTSAQSDAGLSELRDELCNGTSVLTGPSGVGKSSLLNRIQPGLGRRVGEVSERLQKGRHTTVTAELIRLDCGGYVADTPGLRELGLWGIEPEELELCFPEFTAHRGRCRYGNSCLHTHEPGCAVRDAVERGEVLASRYDSYRRMFEGEED